MNKTLCGIVAELQGSLFYNALVLMKFVLCALGSLLTAVQWKRRGVRWLVHANSKAFFAQYYALLTVLGALYAWIYAFEFIRLRFPCFEFDFRYLMVIRSAGMATIISSHYIMVSLSLERLYSSLYPLRFEQISSKFVAIITGTTITLLSYVFIFYAMSDRFDLFTKVIEVATIDLRIPENSNGYQIVVNFITYSVILTGVIFIVDIYLNYFRKTTRRSSVSATGSALGITYQFSENRKVISTLLPVEIINSLLSVFAALAQVVYTKVDPKSVSFLDRALFSEIVAVSPVYPLAFAIIIEWRIGFRKTPTITVMNGEEEHAHHFATLQTAWQSQK